MKIEAGKLYRTYDNRKVRIYSVDGGSIWPVHGAIWHEPTQSWSIYHWKENGRYNHGDKPGLSDLIEEWTEPKKTKELWLWVYEVLKSKNEYYTSDYWRTEQEAQDYANKAGYKLIGKCPTCVKPLVVEE